MLFMLFMLLCYYAIIPPGGIFLLSLSSFQVPAARRRCIKPSTSPQIAGQTAQSVPDSLVEQKETTLSSGQGGVYQSSSSSSSAYIVSRPFSRRSS